MLTNMTAGFSTMPLHWHDVIRKNLRTCTLLTAVSSSMARRKVPCSNNGGRATEAETDVNGSLSQHCDQNTASMHSEVASFCCVKLSAEMLETNLYELTASFQRCILETERIETRGN